MQSFGDDPWRADAVRGLYLANVPFVVVAHDGHLIAALQLGDRALRNEQCAWNRAHGETDSGVLPRTQRVVGIGKQASNADRTGTDVHFAVREIEASSMGMDRPVGENQFQVQGAALGSEGLGRR